MPLNFECRNPKKSPDTYTAGPFTFTNVGESAGTPFEVEFDLSDMMLRRMALKALHNKGGKTKIGPMTARVTKGAVRS